MALSLDSTTCTRPRLFEPMVRFGPAFSGSRLDAAGAIIDFGLRDQSEQEIVMHRIGGQALRSPLDPQLHGMFEADVAGQYVGVERGLRISRKEGQRFRARRSMVSRHVGPQLVKQDVVNFLSETIIRQ